MKHLKYSKSVVINSGTFKSNVYLNKEEELLNRKKFYSRYLDKFLWLNSKLNI